MSTNEQNKIGLTGSSEIIPNSKRNDTFREELPAYTFSDPDELEQFLRDTTANALDITIGPSGEFYVYETPNSTQRIYGFYSEAVQATPLAPTVVPPRGAEYLLYLALSKQDRIAMIADLDEEYVTIIEKFGARGADFWYWTQAVRSAWPLIKAAVTKAVKVGLLGWAEHVVRKIIGGG